MTDEPMDIESNQSNLLKSNTGNAKDLAQNNNNVRKSQDQFFSFNALSKTNSNIEIGK